MVDFHGFDRVGHRLRPVRAYLVQRDADSDPVYVAVGCQRADQNRHIVLPATAVIDIGKQERFPVSVRYAATILPAHQRMKFRVLIDRLVDTQQQTGSLQGGDMVLQIGIGSRMLRSRRIQIRRHDLPLLGFKIRHPGTGPYLLILRLQNSRINTPPYGTVTCCSSRACERRKQYMMLTCTVDALLER